MINEQDPIFLFMLNNRREQIRPYIKISEAMALIELVKKCHKDGILTSYLSREQSAKLRGFANSLYDSVERRWNDNGANVYLEQLTGHSYTVPEPGLTEEERWSIIQEQSKKAQPLTVADLASEPEVDPEGQSDRKEENRES